MTDAKTIKALECCTNFNKGCKQCPYLNHHCWTSLVRDVLALIKRRREEKEELTETLKNLAYEYRELEASVKFRKAEIRAEAIREFAERLDDYLTINCTIEKNAVKSSIADDDIYFHGGKEIAFADVKQRIISILQELTEEQK